MIDEGSRHALFQRLEHALGSQEATTLMEHLPPVGWADDATREYVDLRLQATEQSLRVTVKDEMGRVRDEIGRVRGEIGQVRDEITKQTRAMVLSGLGLMVTVMFGLTGVVTAVA